MQKTIRTKGKARNALINVYFALGAIFAILIFATMTHCKPFPVTIVGINDGDSLRLSTGEGFEFDARLHGIDAPELDQKQGKYCRDKLVELTDGEKLKAFVIAEDSFNRKLIKLIREDFSEINFAMIEAGCAFVYSAKRNERAKYKEAFRIAYTEKIGMFADEVFCEPRKYRKGTCTE